jgi:hypothetical protein
VLWQNNRSLADVPIGGEDSAVLGMNASGTIVGAMGNQPKGGGAFVLAKGQLFRLSDLVHGDVGWKLEAATAINDRGWIVGSGTLRGKGHAFLCIPIR